MVVKQKIWTFEKLLNFHLYNKQNTELSAFHSYQNLLDESKYSATGLLPNIIKGIGILQIILWVATFTKNPMAKKISIGDFVPLQVPSYSGLKNKHRYDTQIKKFR